MLREELLAVPLFSQYVVSRSESARPSTATAVLSLAEMTANAGLAAPYSRRRMGEAESQPVACR